MRLRHSSVARMRGVSLVEALVALAVMSFGMLGVVGVQATLRFNAEIAKQRSEAVRIGQEEMETLRTFAQLGTDPAGQRRAFDDIQNDIAGRVVTGYQTNASYVIKRAVTDSTDRLHKRIRLEVLWADRNGAEQKIVLSSSVARLSPELSAGLLRKETLLSPESRPQGRNVAIPLEAKDLQNGLSVFKPSLDGTDNGTTAWVFNNATGLIVGNCTVAAGTSTASLAAGQVANCSDNTLMQLLSGYVRFSTGATQPTAADAEQPKSPVRNLDIRLSLSDTRTPTCFDNAAATAAVAQTQFAVTYYCAIPVNAARTWAGFSTIVTRAFSDVANSNWQIPANGVPVNAVDHKLCRYTPATSDTQWVSNDKHPRQYGFDEKGQPQKLPMPALVNQNFLVIRAGFNCPTDGPANPAIGDYVNSNTLEHLPLPP